MKDKVVRASFVESDFHNKVHDNYLGYIGELQLCKDKKYEIFIQENYFHSVLDDAMEFLLKTPHARNGMKSQQIIRILFDREVLSEKDAKSAVKINKIRNFFAHGYDTPNIIHNAEEMIKKIKLELTDFSSIPGNDDVSVKELMEKACTEWDMYQKLDFVIHGLVIDIKNKVLFIKN